MHVGAKNLSPTPSVPLGACPAPTGNRKPETGNRKKAVSLETALFVDFPLSFIPYSSLVMDIAAPGRVAVIELSYMAEQLMAGSMYSPG
jgi:hypothetical protein